MIEEALEIFLRGVSHGIKKAPRTAAILFGAVGIEIGYLYGLSQTTPAHPTNPASDKAEPNAPPAAPSKNWVSEVSATPDIAPAIKR